MNSSTVKALGAYCPHTKVDNSYFEGILDTSDTWIRERTGIESRYFAAENEYTGDMCVNAALDMQKNFNVDFSDVDFIIVASMTPDQTIPNVASQIQTRLGIRNTGAVDICCACSGFCYGLTMAKGLIAAGCCRKILVFGAETMSRIIDFKDRNTCILFGDGAGCALVERSEENTVFECFSGTDGSMGKELYLSTRNRYVNGAEIIADGCHLPPSLLRLIYRCKGPQRICLVTDSMRAAGTECTRSLLGGLKNGQEVEVADGVAYMPGRASFGGSIATADRLVRTMYRQAGVPLEHAVEMITRTPAQMLNILHRKGTIEVGKDADLVLFDEDLRIMAGMVNGNLWEDHVKRCPPSRM